MTPERPTPTRTGHAIAVGLGIADEVVVTCVRGVHQAVSRTAWGRLPGSVPLVAAVAAAQQATTAGIYAAVSGGLRAGGALAGHLAARGTGARVEDSPRSRTLRSAVNAYYGDRLTGRDDPYALTMTLRVDDRDVAPTAAELSEAYPAARADLVVFVHGLGESDRSWDRHARERGTTYPQQVEHPVDGRPALTPVLVRYNTGCRVSDSGADLDALLDAVVGAWPLPVERLHLVGHSMGGLVIRSALSQGSERGAPWAHRVATIVSLGTPHRGAPLERLAHNGSRVLRAVEHSRPFADLLDSRSSGILDLRHGTITETDSRATGPAAGESREAMAGVPAPTRPGLVHHLVAAGALPGPETILTRWVGDLVVPTDSASGSQDAASLVPKVVVHRVRGTHQSLLNHPEVAQVLDDVLHSR